ncbi:MAG: hypothetical protein ACE5JL_13325, partial [Dehalococcoidia bacterium]
VLYPPEGACTSPNLFGSSGLKSVQKSLTRYSQAAASRQFAIAQGRVRVGGADPPRHRGTVVCELAD